MRWLVGLWLIVGCGGTFVAARPPTSEAAIEGVAHDWRMIRAEDGTELFTQCWTPEGEPSGVLVVVHGIKDHSSRYEELAVSGVRDEGLAVCGMDHRGHGRSAGARADVDDFDVYLDDLEVWLAQVRARFDGRPIFLFGHSMGGALSTLLVLERRVDVAGVILSAPALRVDRLPIEIAATQLFAALAPGFPILSSDDEDFSRDAEVVSRMTSDPLIYHDTHPASLAGAFVDGIARVWTRADQFDRPLLALHGTGDVLTDPRGSAELVRRARTRDATLRTYPGLYHDLVHEPEKERVMTDVLAWIRERLR